jgi:hypothetical protein
LIEPHTGFGVGEFGLMVAYISHEPPSGASR